MGFQHPHTSRISEKDKELQENFLFPHSFLLNILKVYINQPSANMKILQFLIYIRWPNQLWRQRNVNNLVFVSDF